MTTSRTIYFALGRAGDILNILPMVKAAHDRGERPVLCVAKEFEDLPDAVSYCDKLVWPGLYNDPPAALRWIKANRPRDRIIIAQFYRNPVDQNRLTASYQMESWRIARRLDDFGTQPLILDRRSPEREVALRQRVNPDHRSMILVATQSVSSPFAHGFKLLDRLKQENPGSMIVDMGGVRADHIVDLLGLYDRAACLVTVDSVGLHLCRASRVPVIAIRNNGWNGSVLPPTCVADFRYANIELEDDGLGMVAEAVNAVVEPAARPFVVHACQMWGKDARHERAQATWNAAYGDEQIIECLERPEAIGQTSGAVGDERQLPFLRDLLDMARASVSDEDDVIILSNDDVGFTREAFTMMRQHVQRWGAFSMRRSHTDMIGTHIGREVFGFTAGWLRSHLPSIPAMYLGAPCWDLVLAAMIRNDRGIRSTMANLTTDFYPCEMSPGLAIHEPHASAWAGPIEQTAIPNVINQRLAREWCAKYAPGLRL